MRYRKFGKLDWEVSALGLGVMRMPVKDGDHGVIDEDRAGEIIRRAIDGGVNYLDTAWNYHRDNSEGFLGRFLAGGYREKVRIATKMPCWLVEKPDDFDRFFHEQMERLQVDHIDFYLLHALQRDWWDKMKDFGYLEWAEEKMSRGLIGHLGFSFHDKYPLFRRILEDYDNWTLAMVQHNYMDEEKEAGTSGISLAREKGLAVIAMEPLRGGELAKEPPREVKKVFQETLPGRTPVEWALRWLWDQEDITMVLSGMSSPEHVEQNISLAGATHPGCLGEEEREAIERVRELYLSRAPIGCTDCRYCMPCPEGVAIPFIFDYFNIAEMYDDIRLARAGYAFIDAENRADRCTGCRRCEEHCPQHLPIADLLVKCHGFLSGEKD